MGATSAIAFANRQQFGRRNQEANWIAYQRGQRYQVEKLTKAEAGAIGGAVSKDNETQKPCPCLQKTADVIAKESSCNPC